MRNRSKRRPARLYEKQSAFSNHARENQRDHQVRQPEGKGDVNAHTGGHCPGNNNRERQQESPESSGIRKRLFALLGSTLLPSEGSLRDVAVMLASGPENDSEIGDISA